jgi:hypothetical protein
MKNKILFACLILIIMLVPASVPGSSLTQQTQPQQKQTNNATITCYLTGIPQTTTVTAESAQHLKDLLTSLTLATGRDPQSPETQQLQAQILVYAEAQHLLPASMTADQVQVTLQKQRMRFTSQHPAATALPGTDQEFWCNFATTGDGSAFPVIILPRLIPIIQLPIPRVYVGWKTDNGVTSVGGLVTRTGFIATGQQKGTALGFWGVGFSIFLPPVSAYGLFGYAAYAKVTAASMEQWPPNNEPQLDAVYPLDGATKVPISTTSLQFHISDEDKNPMSYSVSTYPDVGGENAELVENGTYLIPVSNLQSSTTYSWTVQVNDGEDFVSKTFTFTTEYLAPQILDPVPIDGAYYVPITLSSLNFTLNDHQNDPIDWTVQTAPDIGSGSGTNDGNGRYSVPIQSSDLQYNSTYTWYVNATDGTYWNRQVFTFKTIREGISPYIYVGGESGTVSRYLKEGFVKDMESPYYNGRIMDITSDGQCLYTGGLNQGTVWQLRFSDLSVKAESSFFGEISDLECYGPYLYVAGWPSDNRVLQFWTSNMTLRAQTIQLPSNGVCGISCNGDYLYAAGGLDYQYGYLYQFWTSNMTMRQVVNVDSGRFWSVLAVGSSIYVGSSSPYQGGVVLQYRASDLALLNTAFYGGTVFALAFDGSYLYAGGHGAQKVYKFWPSNLTKIAESQNYGGYIDTIMFDGAYLYVGGLTSCRIWQMRPSDLAVVAQSPVLDGDIQALWP